LFGSRLLQPVISFMTLSKGIMLVLLVVVTAVVAVDANHVITNSWKYIGRPFLIGTVALGGAVNIMPIIFAKIQPRPRDIKIFMASTIAGLFTVWILNVLWCYYILKIVPQTALEDAGKLGQISTIPLVYIIDKDFPKYKWIAIIITVFIMISITVSYLTIGSGLKHVLDGYTKLTRYEPSADSRSFWGRLRRRVLSIQKWKRQYLLYFVCFGIVLAVSLLQPKSFHQVLEKVTSFALNLEAGAFIALMLANSRKFNLRIPLPLSNWMVSLRYIVAGYFLFAVLYDIIAVVLEAFNVRSFL